MVDRASADPVTASSEPPARATSSRLRTCLVGSGIAVLIVLIVWPRQRSNLAHFDPAKWGTHEGREGMVGDVVRMIDHDTIFSESMAEAHLGRPDHNQKYSDNRPVWWYSIDAQRGLPATGLRQRRSLRFARVRAAQ